MSGLKSIKAYKVNAFTKGNSGGNPIGVVLDATGLNDEQMQFVADKIAVSHGIVKVKVKKVANHLETIIGGTAKIETEMMVALN